MNSKNFVVFGGSRGIGLEISRVLCGRGHRLFVVSRSPGGMDTNDAVTHISADVTADDLSALPLPDTIQGMAYCPGSIVLRPFQRLTASQFKADIDVNLIGAVKAIQAVLPGLKRADTPGSIVLFSTVAVGTGMPFHASIASAKGAVEGLVRALAAELAPNVRVNAVAPSLTDTPLAAGLLSDEKKRAAAAARHPLKRVGSARDVAAAAAFLLDDLSAWTTGQILGVDGGMGALRTFR